MIEEITIKFGKELNPIKASWKSQLYNEKSLLSHKPETTFSKKQSKNIQIFFLSLIEPRNLAKIAPFLIHPQQTKQATRHKSKEKKDTVGKQSKERSKADQRKEKEAKMT